MIKSILFCVLAITAFSACTKNKIENFFIPPEGKNVSEFNLLHEDGTISEHNVSISFVKLDENHIKTSEMNGFAEKAKLGTGQPELDLKKYSKYLITNDEILLESFEYYNLLTSERENTKLNPAQIILKLPQNSKIVKWIIKEHNNTEWDCTAELILVEIDGNKQRAIKLTKRIMADEKYNWANKIEYYVEGIGLWKICMEKTGQVFQLLDRQY